MKNIIERIRDQITNATCDEEKDQFEEALREETSKEELMTEFEKNYNDRKREAMEGGKNYELLYYREYIMLKLCNYGLSLEDAAEFLEVPRNDGRLVYDEKRFLWDVTDVLYNKHHIPYEAAYRALYLVGIGDVLINKVLMNALGKKVTAETVADALLESGIAEKAYDELEGIA